MTFDDNLKINYPQIRTFNICSSDAVNRLFAIVYTEEEIRCVFGDN